MMVPKCYWNARNHENVRHMHNGLETLTIQGSKPIYSRNMLVEGALSIVSTRVSPALSSPCLSSLSFRFRRPSAPVATRWLAHRLIRCASFSSLELRVRFGLALQEVIHSAERAKNLTPEITRIACYRGQVVQAGDRHVVTARP